VQYKSQTKVSTRCVPLRRRTSTIGRRLLSLSRLLNWLSIGTELDRLLLSGSLGDGLSVRAKFGLLWFFSLDNGLSVGSKFWFLWLFRFYDRLSIRAELGFARLANFDNWLSIRANLGLLGLSGRFFRRRRRRNYNNTI
jgi:hypothetical protein